MVGVAMLHPDLGIGGAERLVVDAAVALQRSGHNVHIYTSHHDRRHCFSETRDGTLRVTVYGDWLPRHIFGYLHAVCAYFRMIYLALMVVWFTPTVDVFICDQVSVCIPILCRTSARVLFYCHFPDQLLAKKTSQLKDMYRAPLNWLEEKTTGMADLILVNSQFTAQTFRDTFQTLTVVPEVLYPSLDFRAFDINVNLDVGIPESANPVFLSINRYERKKNLMLALEALSELKTMLMPTDQELWNSVHLIMAGGYDPRVTENVEYFAELTAFAEEQGLAEHVTFKQSFSDTEKVALLQRCSCLIYTPDNEHFGITPLEAMYCCRPVIAVKSGGPLETISSEETAHKDDPPTGFLREPEPRAFAQAMKRWCTDSDSVKEFGVNGRKRVLARFSFGQFQWQLNRMVELEAKKRVKKD